MANEWASGSDLAGMSRGGNLLQQMGYDPDEVKTNPDMRAELMQKLGSPMQMAQNTPPPPANPNPRSQNGNSIAPTAPGTPRLFNRQQPSLPPPASLPTPQSMAGAAPTSSAVSPSGTPNPSLANSEQAQQDLLSPAPQAADTTAQDAMIAAKSVPVNPRDPMYKEGVMGRIGRGFKAAAVGFGKGGVPESIEGAADPTTVGVKPYGAPNADYDIDESIRKGQLGRAQADKANAIDEAARKIAAFKQMTDTRDKAGTIANSAAKLPNETTSANAAATTAAAAQQRANQEGQPKNEQEALSKAYTSEDPKEAAKYFAMAKAMHTNTMQEKPPRESLPSAELQMLDDWKAAFRHDNGRAPTAKEIEQFRSAKSGDKGAPTKAGFEGLLKQRDADYTTQQKNYEQARKAAQDDPQALAAVDADNRNKLNDLQNGWNQRLADYDPDGTLSHAGTPGPVAAPPAQAPKPPALGEVRKGYRYTGGDPANQASWSKVKPKGK